MEKRVKLKKQSSFKWAEQYKISLGMWNSVENPNLRVLDPDGWDRKNLEKSFSEKITMQEFGNRVCMSTIQPLKESIITGIQNFNGVLQ